MNRNGQRKQSVFLLMRSYYLCLFAGSVYFHPMLTSNRMILVIAITFLHFKGMAQQSNQDYRGDENYLRMCVIWTDSTEYQIPGFTSENSRSIYLFQVSYCSWGIYASREIYIAAAEQSIASRFNPMRALNKNYYWTLRKSEFEVNGRPLYIHSGNF